MTFAQQKGNIDQSLSTFRGLSVDTQLAFLWFVYTKMGESITPAAPGAAEPDIADGLYNQVKELSQEEQLQVQRDILQQTSTPITREYGALSNNTRLLFWYRLAQGMEEGTIIPMPENYQLADEAKNLLAALETMDFNQQITFLRKVVEPSGSDSIPGTGI